MTKKYSKRRTYKLGKFCSFKFHTDYIKQPKYRIRRVINLASEENYIVNH